MARRVLLASLAVALFAASAPLSALASTPPTASAVVELTDLNFDSLVDGRSTWLVLAQAPGASWAARSLRLASGRRARAARRGRPFPPPCARPARSVAARRESSGERGSTHRRQ